MEKWMGALLLALVLAAPIASACVWVETVEVALFSQNRVPIPGGAVEVRYQKNAANLTDGLATGISGPDGKARIYLCDQAPAPTLYNYTVTVREPYGGTAQQWKGVHDPARNGTNRIAFEFRIAAYNMTVYVEDEAGEPVGMANVSVRGAYSMGAETNSSGFAWVILPPGSYTVSASFGNASLSRDISISSHLSLTLAPPRPLNNTLEITVYDDEGALLENASVAISSGGLYAEGATDANGTVGFTGLGVPEAMATISVGGKALRSENITLENFTRISITVDTHPPAISIQAISSKNVGQYGMEDYEIEIRASISDSVTPKGGIKASIEYSTGGNFTSAGMARSGEDFSTRIRSAQPAPFILAYTITATDAAGNMGEKAGEAEITYQPPPPTPTPRPGATPTPRPINVSSGLPEPLKGLIAPVEALLTTISTYMWVMMFLVLVVLGGAVFVFLTGKAFFRLRGAQKPKKKG